MGAGEEKERDDMPTLIEQIERMSVDEKLRLIVYLAKSISPTAVPADAAEPHPGEYRRPRVGEFNGYGRRFHPECRFAEDVMREIR